MASPSQFFDPFFELERPPPIVDGHPLLRAPRSVVTSNDELPVTGQGIIGVRSSAQSGLRISVKADSVRGTTLHLDITRKECFLAYRDETGGHDFDPEPAVLKSKADCWLDPAVQTPVETLYWLSIDKNNGKLRYGKKYTNTSMILLEWQYKHRALVQDAFTMVWNNFERDGWLENVKLVDVEADSAKLTGSSAVKLSSVPLVLDLSPFIVTTDQVTLEELENGFRTVPANLPAACQTLYENVAGKAIVLDNNDFPDFADAIQHSCETPGCWAYDQLQKKAKDAEFGDPDIKLTYLRITLGYNQGNSPGIPYVLEIWPSEHHSPVHDHGDACAVIKVLHGKIEATYFDSLDDLRILGPPVNLEKGDITWLGENNYQIHKLENRGKEVCCTIQCYAYEKNNNKHQDVFNWENKGKVEAWYPTSDWSFLEFRKKMKEEWAARP